MILAHSFFYFRFALTRLPFFYYINVYLHVWVIGYNDYFFCILRVLSRYRCRPLQLQRMEKNTVSQWNVVILRCRNLAVNAMATVVCKRKCTDFVHCSAAGVPRAVTKPVIWERKITDGTNPNIEERIHLPVACQCVKKKRN